jgi:hypothetical protein
MRLEMMVKKVMVMRNDSCEETGKIGIQVSCPG